MRKYMRLATTLAPHIVGRLGWINRYARHPGKVDLDRRYDRLHRFLALTLDNFRVQLLVGGSENIPGDTNAVFVPNHQSNLDPIVLIAHIGHPISFLSKQEVSRFPIVGKIVKGIDGVFMERGNLRQELKAINLVSEALENEPRLSYFIFPEGTRTKDPEKRVQTFKPGALKPAYRAMKPLVPVAVYGTFRILDQKIHLKRYPVQIKFLPPHLPEEYEKIPTTEMAALIEAEVAAEVQKMRERDPELVRFYNR